LDCILHYEIHTRERLKTKLYYEIHTRERLKTKLYDERDDPSAAVFSFYIFTFLMFRKLNKPQLTKNKQHNFIGIRAFDSRLYLDISRSFK
jgi:hypothetical protein